MTSARSCPGVEQRDGGHEPVHETGARGIQVECGTTATELVVDPRRGCGDGLVGAGGREHEKVDLLAAASCPLQGAPGGLDGEP